MNEVMSQSRLYRKLVPSKARLVTSAAVSTLMALIVGVGGGLSVMLVREQQSAWDTLMLCGFLIIFLGILLHLSHNKIVLSVLCVYFRKMACNVNPRGTEMKNVRSKRVGSPAVLADYRRSQPFKHVVRDLRQHQKRIF